MPASSSCLCVFVVIFIILRREAERQPSDPGGDVAPKGTRSTKKISEFFAICASCGQIELGEFSFANHVFDPCSSAISAVEFGARSSLSQGTQRAWEGGCEMGDG